MGLNMGAGGVNDGCRAEWKQTFLAAGWLEQSHTLYRVVRWEREPVSKPAPGDAAGAYGDKTGLLDWARKVPWYCQWGAVY